MIGDVVMYVLLGALLSVSSAVLIVLETRGKTRGGGAKRVASQISGTYRAALRLPTNGRSEAREPKVPE